MAVGESPVGPEPTPWLSGAKPSRALPADQLAERILNLLSSQNVAVLATTGPGGPSATPVRYYSRDFTLFFTANPGSPKMRNIAGDPRVSVGIVAPLVGLASSRGCQVYGTAVVAQPGSSEFLDAMKTYRWQLDAVETGASMTEPPNTAVVRIDATRIVYTEHWLRRDGYAPRHLWRRPER